MSAWLLLGQLAVLCLTIIQSGVTSPLLCAQLSLESSLFHDILLTLRAEVMIRQMHMHPPVFPRSGVSMSISYRQLSITLVSVDRLLHKSLSVSRVT